MRTRQRFVHRHGWVYVQAPDEASARAILARNSYNQKDPGWLYCGAREFALDQPGAKTSDLERLEKWLQQNSST